MTSESVTWHNNNSENANQSTDTKAMIKHRLATFIGKDGSNIDENIRLGDLVTDSFVLIDTVIQLQEEFGVTLYQNDLRAVKTVDDLLVLLEKRLKED